MGKQIFTYYIIPIEDDIHMVRRVLSIEIGLIKTRVCEVSYKKKNPHIYQCITFDTPDNTMEDGYIRNKEVFGAVLRENLAKANIKITNVIFTISSTKIANREVMIPMVNDNRIQAVIEANVNEYFPVDVSEYIISYSILNRINTKEERKLKLLVLAAPDNLIKNYYSFAQMMNFTIVALDYVGNSAFQILKKQVGQSVNLMVQMNEQSTLINVIDHEVLTLQRTIPYGTMSVIHSILANKDLEADTDTKAVHLLSIEELINKKFNMEEEEAAVALAEVIENETRVNYESKLKEEITESLHYLINNVNRVLDYYNSKFQDRKIETIYIMGQGARFKGLNQLFQNETGYEVKHINRLNSVTFHADCIHQDKFMDDYLCTIGAAIKPINFISREIITKAGKKNDLLSMALIFSFSLFVCLLMIVISTLVLSGALKEKSEYEKKINSMLPVEDLYANHAALQAEYNNYENLYALTKSPNEHLMELFAALEEKLPASMTVTSFSVTNENISLNISAKSTLAVAMALTNLRRVTLISDISVDTITSEKDDNGIITVTLAVNCKYKDSDVSATDTKQEKKE